MYNVFRSEIESDTTATTPLTTNGTFLTSSQPLKDNSNIRVIKIVNVDHQAQQTGL